MGAICRVLQLDFTEAGCREVKATNSSQVGANSVAGGQAVNTAFLRRLNVESSKLATQTVGSGPTLSRIRQSHAEALTEVD